MDTLILLVIPLLLSALWLHSIHQCRKKNNHFGITHWLWPIGAFVWGDVLVLAPFWIVISLFAFALDSALLFWCIYSLFWVVRSAGEVMYWLLEQFSAKRRNKPRDLLGNSFVNGSEAIWFIYQVFWQCVLVLSLVCTGWLATRLIQLI